MMKKKNTAFSWILRILTYLLGLFIIALGINVSKMSKLGISPVSSIPGVLEKVLGWSLGTTVIVVYILLVIAQIIVLRKKFRIVNALGVPVAIVFGWMVDLVGIEKDGFFGNPGLLVNFPRPENLGMQFLYLFVSILIIALGVFVYLKPKIVPMPAEGLAAAIAEKTGKKFGNCKTFVDCGLILIALILQLIFLGGFPTLVPGAGVVGIGTIVSAVCVGQVVKLLNKFYDKISAKKETA